MTAVEWLIKQIDEKNNGVSNSMTYLSIFEQAKEIEKQQIIDAVDGFPLENRNLDGKQYYEQTFKKK